MAGSAQIGALRVSLSIDSAEFQAGAKRAQSTLAGLQSSIKSFSGAFIAAFSSGALAGLGIAIKSSINHMDELNKSAQKMGFPVAELSSWEYAAKLADVSLGDLEASVSKFDKALNKIAAGEKSGAGNALRAIGVSATDANGKLKPTPAILSEIADKFASYRDGATKTALAIELFGKSGAQMIPLLNAGASGIQEATAEAERFGIVVNQEAAAAAEQFNDNLTRLEAAGGGLVNRIAQELVPELGHLTDEMVSVAAQGEVVTQVSEGISAVMSEVARFVIEASSAWAELTTWANAAGASFAALKNGDISGAASAWTDAATKVNEIWADTERRVNSVMEGGVQSVNYLGKGDFPSEKKDAPSFVTGTGGGKNKSKKPRTPKMDEYQEVLRDQEAELRNIGKSNLTIAINNRLRDAGVTAMSKAGLVIAANETKIYRLTKAEEMEAEASAWAIERQSELFDAKMSIASMGVDTFEQWAIEGQSLKESLADLTKQLARMAIQATLLGEGPLANLFGTASGQGLFGSMFNSGVHPLYGGKAGGGGFLSGIGKLFGFADGGSFNVGGSGGIDSQLVAFRASPNERVTVTKPDQNWRSGGTSVTIIDQRTNAPPVQQQRGSDGSMRFVIRDAMRAEIASGSMDAAQRERHGLVPAKVKR